MTYGTIVGTALWYGRLCTRRLDGSLFYLSVQPGALYVPADVALRIDHNEFHNVAGAELTFSDDGERLTFRADLPNTTDARIAIAGVRDGTRAGASAGMTIRAYHTEEIDGDVVVTVTNARLRELSLVDEPAIRGCRVEIADGEQAGDDIDRHIAIMREARWAASRLMARW